MKTKLITSLKKNVLLVDGLPENASEVKDTLANGVYYKLPDGNYDSIYIPDEIKGNWKLLGNLKDLTEEQRWELVSMHKVSNSHWKYANYKNLSGLWFDSSEESFLSALEALGLHLNGNPIHKELGFIGTISEIDIQIALQKQQRRWQGAEQNVFSENTLVFVGQ